MIEFKEYEESLTSEVGPNLTPMIDMMFLLLIFFLLTSFLVRPSIPVNLPETETAEMEEQSEVRITVLADGRLVLNGDEVTAGQLERRLSRLGGIKHTREVVIQADRNVVFERVVEVMDISKKSGMETISFLVEHK
jgi:biopolymer transport protein ExbD